MQRFFVIAALACLCALATVRSQELSPSFIDETGPLSGSLSLPSSSSTLNSNSERQSSTDSSVDKLIKSAKGKKQRNDIDQWVNGLIKRFTARVKSGKYKNPRGNEVKIIGNSNTLTHEETPTGPTAEEKFKATQEEIKKQGAEQQSKTKDEEKLKAAEQESKQNVINLKKQVREESLKQDAEQDDKTAAEEKTKAAEAQQKKGFEAKQKKAVADAKTAANEAAKKAQAQLDAKKKQEAGEKDQLEQSTKREIQAAQQAAAKQRELSAKELAEKKQQEQKDKNDAIKKEENDKAEEKRKEEQEHKKKQQATGKWCQCTDKTVDFRNRENTFLSCSAGYLVTGLYRQNTNDQPHSLAQIQYFKCCRPCTDAGNQVMGVTACTEADWGRSFDGAGYSPCPDNYYIQGLYKSSCNWIYCIEKAKCCKIQGSKGKKDCNQMAWRSTDGNWQGWYVSSADRFWGGLARNGNSHYLHAITYAWQCSYYAYDL